MNAKFVSVLKGCLIAAAGAGLAYLASWATSTSGTADLGIYGPAVGAGLSVVVNVIRQLTVVA